ncbi:MAG: class I SAM-dependent methyltransferase [Oscillochloridaceae bacterium umkhey_bin13]
MTESNARLQQASFSDFSVPDFPRIRKVLRFFRDRSPGICLDLGYCPGSFADYLVQQGWSCVGLDIVQRVNAGSGVQHLQSDIFRGLPIADQQVDAITAGELIEHLTDDGAFLRECWRVLKPGGLLALTTPNLTFALNRGLILLGKMPKFVHEPYHYRIYNLDSLHQTVTTAGFTVRAVTSSHTLYSTRLHPSGIVFEWLGDRLPSFGAHLIVLAQK